MAWLRFFLSVALLAGAAWAGPSPYSRWARPLETLEGAAVGEHVAQAPLLARPWLAGRLAELAQGDVRTRAVAEALADVPWVAAHLALEAPALDKAARRVRAAVRALASGESAIRALSRVRDTHEAHAVCYGVLFDAWQARAKYAGWGDTTARLAAARRVAALLVVLDDDLTPWRAMAAWVGEPIVPDRTLTGVSRMEARGMNALLTDQPAAARRHFTAASYAASRDPLAPVWLLAVAMAETRLGRTAGAETARAKAARAVVAGPLWLRTALRARTAAVAVEKARSAKD